MHARPLHATIDRTHAPRRDAIHPTSRCLTWIGRVAAGLGLACAVWSLSAPKARAADGLTLGGQVGTSSYGTALKAQVGGGLSLPVAPGMWRWQGQVTSFGRETYSEFGNQNQRTAWSAGISALPSLRFSPGWTAYGKIGAHYLRSESSGPGLDSARSGVKLGLGAGLLWQVTPQVGVVLEVENIGGGSGDLLSLGAQVAM